MFKYLDFAVHISRAAILISKNFNHEDLFLSNAWAAKVYKTYQESCQEDGQDLTCQKISSGSIEWSCAADVTTIPQCHEKTLTQIEACYVESIVKADELFANWVQEHLERLWCSSEGIRCSITNSFVSNRKNEFVRSLKYCYIIYQFSVLTPKYSISEVNKIQRIRERKTKTYYQL